MSLRRLGGLGLLGPTTTPTTMMPSAMSTTRRWGSTSLFAFGTKLNPMALGDRLNRCRICLAADAREFTEKLFQSWGRNSPHELQQPCAGIAHAMPRLPLDVKQRPWHHGHGVVVEDRPPLPLVHKQHFIMLKMSVHRNGGSGEDGFGPHREGGPRSPRIDLDDHLTRRGRSELEDLALA